MATPGFTAEASLGNSPGKFALTLRQRAESAKVLPQFCLRNEGGVTCCECWDEGGISGCYCHRLVAFQAPGR